MIKEPAPNQWISGQQLSGSDLPMVDVRTRDAFNECHIPGSKSICVYEIAFMEEFPKQFPDKAAPIVIYGEGDPYKADLAALSRLDSLGYRNIVVLKGGLSRWKADGNPVEGSGSLSGVSPDGIYGLDISRSKVRWIGRNLTNQHDGEVASKGGYLKLNEEGIPVAGEVVMDLKQMSCRDIEDSGLAKVLIDHLCNTDFFDVENYPEATFKLESAEVIENATYGTPNYLIKGILTARGKDMPLSVKAMLEPVENGYVFQSVFNFDRTVVGACYGSGRLFESLGMHLVNDLVTIDVIAFFTSSR